MRKSFDLSDFCHEDIKGKILKFRHSVRIALYRNALLNRDMGEVSLCQVIVGHVLVFHCFPDFRLREKKVTNTTSRRAEVLI